MCARRPPCSIAAVYRSDLDQQRHFACQFLRKRKDALGWLVYFGNSRIQLDTVAASISVGSQRRRRTGCRTVHSLRTHSTHCITGARWSSDLMCSSQRRTAIERYQIAFKYRRVGRIHWSSERFERLFSQNQTKEK